MSRIRKLLAGALGVFALSVAAAPVAHAQPLPGGSVTLPPMGPIAVPVPMGSTAGQLPPLPFPLFWQDPVPPPPPTPRYVASNWVEAGTWCPAPHQWAYAQDGAKLWCVQLELTDGFQWAPHRTPIPWTREASNSGKATSVANSLGGKRCDRQGSTAVDPSNGQEAYCAMKQLGVQELVWMYEPGS